MIVWKDLKIRLSSSYLTYGKSSYLIIIYRQLSTPSFDVFLFHDTGQMKTCWKRKDIKKIEDLEGSAKHSSNFDKAFKMDGFIYFHLN